jgi:hypothetical protein
MVVADRGSDAPRPGPADSDRARRADAGVEGNARLTGSLAAVLFVLLAVEGFTILGVRRLLAPHVFVGMVLVPPVVAKTLSTGYRFLRYYAGAPAYRRRGAPPLVLRVLGPFVVLSTLVVLATGIALMYVPTSSRQALLFLHKASFVLWFGAMAIHVVGHLLDTTRLAPADWVRRSRRQVAGAGLRQWAVALCLVAGALLGAVVVEQVGPWLASPGPLGN